MAVGSGKGGGIERDADVFISYQRDTADKARRLADALRRDNREVWLDLKLSSDARWRADIEKKLHRARCVVAIWSKKAATSGWVNYEAFRAQQEGKLVAVTFDPIKPNDLPEWLTDQQITSLRDWKSPEDNHNGWLNVARTVRAKCSKMPDYRFKGWLGGGATHERVTSLVFHPTEDARLVSTGSEGSTASWLTTRANIDARGDNSSESSPRIDPAKYGQLARFTAPQPQKEGYSASIWRSQFSRDGLRVILACRDGVARVLDANFDSIPIELPHNELCHVSRMAFAEGAKGQHRDGVIDACFLDDGGYVTVGGSRVAVWNEDGTPARPEPMQLSGGAKASVVRALQCDLVEGGVILGDKLGKVRLIDPRTAEDFFQIADRDDTGVQLALGPLMLDGKKRQGILAVVSESPLDSEVRFHDYSLAPGPFEKWRPKTILDDAPPVRSIALHPEAPVLAIGSSAVVPRLHDYVAHEPLPLGRDGWHDRGITAVAFSANGKYLAAGSEDGRISVWEDRAQPF
jgi:WD40 repeat protein